MLVQVYGLLLEWATRFLRIKIVILKMKMDKRHQSHVSKQFEIQADISLFFLMTMKWETCGIEENLSESVLKIMLSCVNSSTALL